MARACIWPSPPVSLSESNSTNIQLSYQTRGRFCYVSTFSISGWLYAQYNNVYKSKWHSGWIPADTRRQTHMKAIRFYYHRQSSIYLNAAAFATMVFRCVDDILLYVETITLLGNGETYSLLVCVCRQRQAENCCWFGLLDYGCISCA